MFLKIKEVEEELCDFVDVEIGLSLNVKFKSYVELYILIRFYLKDKGMVEDD